MNRKLTYSVSMSVEHLDGRLGRQFAGTQIKGLFVIEGLGTDFDDPIGKTFTVSGKVIELLDEKGNPIYLQNVEMEDMRFTNEEYILEAMMFNGEFSNRYMKMSFAGTIAPDWSAISNVIAEIDVTGWIDLLADNGIVKGSMKLESTEQEEEPEGIDLSEVNWLDMDISDWEETSIMTSVRRSGGRITMDYDKAREWPVVQTGGTDVVCNFLILAMINGEWNCATWEYGRPGQTTKSIPNWDEKIRSSVFNGWHPQEGEEIYFMAATPHRDPRLVGSVRERTQPYRYVWS